MTQTMKVVSVVIGLNGSNCVGKLVSEIKVNFTVHDNPNMLS